MSARTVLLTGCFGNIGEKVVTKLLVKGYRVIGFDLDNPKNRKVAKGLGSSLEIVWGDITDEVLVRKLVARADAVIHTAAMLPHLTEVMPALAERVNIGGTASIVGAIQDEKAKGKNIHLVFTSSVSVHGLNSHDSPYPKKITAPLQAADKYAASKIRCEELIDGSEISWTVVRIGACLDADSKVGDEDVKKGLRVLFGVHPDCRIEYVHPLDVATAVVNAVDNPEAVGRKFFLGGGKHCQTTWHDFGAVTFVAMGLGLPPREYYSTGSYYTDWMDTGESQEILQFQKHTLDDYRREVAGKFKWIRPLLWLVSPLLRKYLFGMSPYIKSA